ncbi:hypothetical protein BDV98DRAFT_521135 [Pterulicium gracile]|uniref:Kinase n=1 Tax=Pterulicium gracile TaxID=1884261 RepID=A0A5C3R120_9AGAR|nr:hypothetical protein BDV98DRAFT_521135 [Pterula gracilis]
MSDSAVPQSTLASASVLTSQVGGHSGVMASEDGSLLMKPALPLELAFYQTELIQNPALQGLRPFVPKFYGTLRLEGQAGEGGIMEVKPVPEEGMPKESLVLENLSHRFTKPNILDIKLGTILHDDDAPPEKAERMTNTAKNTTSFETGVRLTGFQVYDNTTGTAINTPKSYGKSIKRTDLPSGIARFFPCSHPAEGLPRSTLLPILQGIKENVEEIRDAVKGVEIRMVATSLLIMYEGDVEKAGEGVRYMDMDEDEDVPEEKEEDDSDDDDEEEEGSKWPFVVKLIDFAHTKHVPGQGPDEGFLKGVDTTLRLLEGRIKEVEAIEETKA